MGKADGHVRSRPPSSSSVLFWWMLRHCCVGVCGLGGVMILFLMLWRIYCSPCEHAFFDCIELSPIPARSLGCLCAVDVFKSSTLKLLLIYEINMCLQFYIHWCAAPYEQPSYISLDCTLLTITGDALAGRCWPAKDTFTSCERTYLLCSIWGDAKVEFLFGRHLTMIRPYIVGKAYRLTFRS